MTATTTVTVCVCDCDHDCDCVCVTATTTVTVTVCLCMWLTVWQWRGACIGRGCCLGLAAAGHVVLRVLHELAEVVLSPLDVRVHVQGHCALVVEYVQVFTLLVSLTRVRCMHSIVCVCASNTKHTCVCIRHEDTQISHKSARVELRQGGGGRERKQNRCT